MDFLASVFFNPHTNIVHWVYGNEVQCSEDVVPLCWVNIFYCSWSMVICGRCFQFPPQLRGESCRVGFNRVPSLSQQESLA